nr:uncharacterized protein LOC119181771 [Rhipicephalus microplus]
MEIDDSEGIVNASGMPPRASEPEIYLKSGQFADQGWSHGDDSGLDEAYLDARRTHDIIERRIGIISPPPLSSPDVFLPPLDTTRLLLSRPSKGRRSAGNNGAVAGGATTATTTYQWSNGGTAGTGPYQQHRVTTTTTTTTHRSTTTVEETSVRDQVHLLRLPAPPPKEERDTVEREGKQEESERQQQALGDQSEDRVHEEHTVGEADGPELSDAPPPAASVRRRPSVSSSHLEVTDAKDLAPGFDEVGGKDRADEGDDDSSAQQRDQQQREPGEASAALSPASVRDRRSRSDGAATVTLKLPSPTSDASQTRTFGSQRRPSLSESRRRSVATVPVAESSRLSVPTYQPRKLSFAGGTLGSKRGDDDSGGQRLKSRAQSEEALSQDIEGESERLPRRRPSREAGSRRSSIAVSVDRAEAKPEAEVKAEEGEAVTKAEVQAAQAVRDDHAGGGGGSSSAEDASSDQEARTGHVQVSPSEAEVDRVASEADRDRDEQQEEAARVADGYSGREEVEPEGESRDYFHEEGPYRLEVTEEEENEESALAQGTAVAPVGKAGDVITAPSSQRTWKTTGAGDRASRRSKYPSSVGQPQLQKQQQKQQLSTRAPAATRGGASVNQPVAGGVKAASKSEMSAPERVTGGKSRKQPKGKSSGVTVQVAKVRLIPGRPAADAGTAEAEAEVSEIKDYVRRGSERIRDGVGERDASRRASRNAVINVDTARTVVESYRKSDAAAAAAAKKPKRERTFDVEVYVTELGETGTQTGGGSEASVKAAKERGSSSKGGGGGSGARRRSRSHKSLSKSDTRGSLIGDKGHVRGDKGTDTTDADASSLADSAGIVQDDPSMKDDSEAEQERCEIESGLLDNERQITHTGNGVDENISADDEGSGDETSIEHASVLNEALHPALDSGLDGDKIKPSVTELQGMANTPKIEDNIASTEQSEALNDAWQPSSLSDDDKTGYSEKSGTGEEVGDNVLNDNNALRTAAADTHDVEIIESEESTFTFDRRQTDVVDNHGYAASEPDESEKCNGHGETSTPNPKDMDSMLVTERNDIDQIQNKSKGVDDEETNNHSSRNTELSLGIERVDSPGVKHKEEDIQRREITDDKGAVAIEEENALTGEETTVDEHQSTPSKSGRHLQQSGNGEDESGNDDSNDTDAPEKCTADKNYVEALENHDNVDDQAENEGGTSSRVNNKVEGTTKVDTERNVSEVGTRPGTAASGDERNDFRSDKSHYEHTADGDSGLPGSHANLEDGKNSGSYVQAEAKSAIGNKGAQVAESIDQRDDAAANSDERSLNETDIANITSDTEGKESGDTHNGQREVSVLSEPDGKVPNEEQNLHVESNESDTLSTEDKEDAFGSELVAGKPAIGASSVARGDVETNDEITQEATKYEPTALTNQIRRTDDQKNDVGEATDETSPSVEGADNAKDEVAHEESRAEPFTNGKGLEDEAKNDSNEHSQDGSSFAEKKGTDEQDSNVVPDAVEHNEVSKCKAVVENVNSNIVSEESASNDNSVKSLDEEAQTTNTYIDAPERDVSDDHEGEVIEHEPTSNSNKCAGDSAQDTVDSHDETASETLNSASDPQEASATEGKAYEKHRRGSEDPASSDSVEIADAGEGDADPILATNEEKGDEEVQGATHLDEKDLDNEDSDLMEPHHLRDECLGAEGTAVPDQEQQASEAEDEPAVDLIAEKGERDDENKSGDVEQNVSQEIAAESARTKYIADQANQTESAGEQDEVTKHANEHNSTERMKDSETSAEQGKLAIATNGQEDNEPEVHAEEDGVRSAQTQDIAEEMESPAAATDRASPTTDVDTSRAEDDSAFADGTCTSTPSPATSRAELTSPKDLLREGENIDEGILADEPPTTTVSEKDPDEDGEGDGVVDATSSSSGRGSRATVTEVPLPVTQKPQIRGIQQPLSRASRNAEAAKAPKIRAPKGVSVLPSKFKPTMRRHDRKEHPAIGGTGGVRRVRSDGENIDQAPVVASGTALTTPEQHLDNAGRLLGRHSHSVNMEEQGLVEIARLQKKLDALREERLACEAKREDLLRRAKFLQGKATSTRDQARDMWRRRYAEEKKITPKLEEESARWRLELERLHRELLARVEGELRLTGYPRFEQPSNKLSYKIMIAKVLQEIEDLKRRLEYTRISLGAEVRLRTHAEREVKNLREDLLKKKIQVTLTKKETQSVMAPFLRDSFYFVGPI